MYLRMFWAFCFLPRRHIRTEILNAQLSIIICVCVIVTTTEFNWIHRDRARKQDREREKATIGSTWDFCVIPSLFVKYYSFIRFSQWFFSFSFFFALSLSLSLSLSVSLSLSRRSLFLVACIFCSFFFSTKIVCYSIQFIFLLFQFAFVYSSAKKYDENREKTIWWRDEC